MGPIYNLTVEIMRTHMPKEPPYNTLFNSFGDDYWKEEKKTLR